MFENTAERDLRERLEDAGAAAGFWGGGFLAPLSGCGPKAVEQLGDGRFRVATTWGCHELPGSVAGVRDALTRAAAELGYAAEHEASRYPYELYVLVPRG